MSEQPERPELPYQALIRMLVERYPELAAELLREMGYEIGEPPAQPPPPHDIDPDLTPSVLDLALTLLESERDGRPACPFYREAHLADISLAEHVRRCSLWHQDGAEALRCSPTPGAGLEETDANAVDVDMEIPGEVWVGEATEPVFGKHVGQTLLVNVHSPDRCEGRHCVLHNPSDHHMRQWELLWRGDRRIMERICPHGIGHPDPDDMAYQATLPNGDPGVHSCDGCCRRD